MKKCIFIFVLLMSGNWASAQTFPSFEELQQEMLAMRRQMMQQFEQMQQQLMAPDPFFRIDTSGRKGGNFFQFDTSITLDNGSQFFQFFQFGGDTTLQGGSSGNMNDLFRNFFNNDDFFATPQQPRQNFPKDDGNRDPNELLPEERLQLEEEGKLAPPPPPQTPPQPAKPEPKPKVKTIRI